MQNATRYFEPIYYSPFESSFTENMERLVEAEDPKLTAVRRKPWEVEDIVSNTSSGFHKILDGSAYYIYLESTVLSGAGGCRYLYKTMLQEGMTEEQIGSVIYVILGDKEYQLNSLKIINNE